MLYIFYGSDGFSRREALQALKQELDTDGMLSANTTVLDARQTTPQEVFAACDTVPFLGGCRLVIVEGALGGSASGGRGRRSKRREPDAEDAMGPWWVLVDYAARMPEPTTLVLVDGESVDVNLLDALRPLARVQRISLPARREAPGWVQARARAKGLSMDGRASAVLAELVGNDTWMLASELDKLSAYAAGETIREGDVRSLVTDVRDREGYLLADAAADGKPAVATKMLHDLLRKGRPAAVLLLTIEQRYRRIAVAREMVDAGAGGSGIAARLRMDNAYALERLLDQVARHPMPRVLWALDRIAQADYDVKQGRYESEELSLELLVHDLASGDAAAQLA